LYEIGQPVGLLSNGRDAADRIRTEGFDSDYRTRQAAQRSVVMRPEDDRLRPVLEPADRGPAHFQQLRRVLARLELSDGMAIGQTLIEAQQRLAHDTTLIVVLPRCHPELAALLIGLKRRGWVLAVVINTPDINDFAGDAGPLQAVGIETLHLADEATLPHVMRRVAMR